jgi:hypothetical protein
MIDATRSDREVILGVPDADESLGRLERAAHLG